jgi:hypothetical protein
LHNILDPQRFYYYREPGWHHLGVRGDKTQGAREVLSIVGPDFTVQVEPLQTVSGIAIPSHVAVVRPPFGSDQETRVLDLARADYTTPTPLDFAAMWDLFVELPVETMGILGHGERFFITGVLPSIGIKGDEVARYLFLNVQFGRITIDVYETPVRVVCQNTFMFAENSFDERYVIESTGDSKLKVRETLDGLLERRVEKAAAVQETLEILANHRVQPQEDKAVLSAVYPDPKPYLPLGDHEEDQRREELFQKRLEFQRTRRTTALDLFQGAGRGMDHVATAGTAYGLYNAVVELEDYRKGLSEDRPEGFAAIWKGDRARTKERAFTECFEVARAL